MLPLLVYYYAVEDVVLLCSCFSYNLIYCLGGVNFTLRGRFRFYIKTLFYIGFDMLAPLLLNSAPWLDRLEISLTN